MGKDQHWTFITRIAAILLPLAVTIPAEAQIVDVEAYAGSPYGVGRMVVDLTGNRPVSPESDDRIVLTERTGRALYAVTDSAPIRRILRQFLEVEGSPRVAIYFLFRGGEPLDLTLYTPESFDATVEPLRDPRGHSAFVQGWWRQYSRHVTRLARSDDYPPLAENYIAGNVARRMQLPSLGRGRPPRLDQDPVEAAAMSLLLRGDALRMELARETLSGGRTLREDASLAIPSFGGASTAQIPVVEGEIEIEPIAGHVPEDCFYVRFGNFNNYLWFQDFLEEWGSDLRNMINGRGVKFNLNAKLQRQLSLSQTALARVLGPGVISDVALVGDDTLVRDGAGIGILFHARNNAALGNDIGKQRTAMLDREDAAKIETVAIAGRDVSFLHTPDNRVRSFYAVDGDFHFVSTSRSMIERFLRLSSGAGSLAASAEFLHARSLVPINRGDTVFAYFSESYFHKFLTPKYRIEMIRRLRAATDLELIQLARLAARAENRRAATIDELIEADLLPRGFGRRPDGGHPIGQEQLVDSLRGAPGTFLPVADVQIEAMTPSEADAYERFLDSTLARREHINRIAVGISRRDLNDEGLERMSIEAHLLPDPGRQFPLLASLLGEPTTERLAPIEGNIASLELISSGLGIGPFTLRTQTTHLFAGLRDGALPLSVGDGRIEVDSRRQDSIRGYLGAWPRPGLLSLFLGRDAQPPAPGELQRLPGELGWQGQINDFLLLTLREDVFRDVASQLKVEQAERPAQARLEIASLRESQIARAINALGYRQATEISRSGPRLMNALSSQLHVPPEACREEAERLLEAEFVCPLGGDYQLIEHPDGLASWTSTAVPAENRVLLSEVPEDYELALLNWFRGLQGELLFTGEDLTVRIDVDMQQKSKKNGLFQIPSIFGFGK